MVIGEDFIWLHFPKCAGTATEAMLRSVLEADDRTSFDTIDRREGVVWHETPAERAARDPGFSTAGRRIVCNFRRLPAWVLSMAHFERQRSREVTRRAELLRGEYRASNGKLGKADDMARRYAECGVSDWLRVEALRTDFERVFGKPPPPVAKNRGRFEFIRETRFWFTPEELKRLYAANPVWARLERQIYGENTPGVRERPAAAEVG